jgi:hypothetical protein
MKDLCVAAYNGAIPLFKSADNMMLPVKIASVEARHASGLRDLLNPGQGGLTSGKLVNENGLDKSLSPAEVLAEAAPFFKTQFTAPII